MALAVTVVSHQCHSIIDAVTVLSMNLCRHVGGIGVINVKLSELS